MYQTDYKARLRVVRGEGDGHFERNMEMDQLKGRGRGRVFQGVKAGLGFEK